MSTATGSLINRILAAPSPTKPQVGLGATIGWWSDRTAGTIINVSPSGKTFVVQEDRARRTDGFGMSDCQSYEYTPNQNGRTFVVKQTKHGWKTAGAAVTVGYRNAYHDYSF